MVVYLLLNTITGKPYIGQTIQPISRIHRHKRNAANNISGALYKAIRKYGWENFSFRDLEICSSQEELNLAEHHWILYYNSISPEGYNLIGGGNAKGKHSKETLAKLSISHLGHVVKDSTKEKIRLAMKDRVFSPEHRGRISQAKKGISSLAMSKAKIGENNPSCKLSWEVDSRVRVDFLSGLYTQKELSLKYSIKPTNLTAITQWRSWKEPHYHDNVQLLT